MTITIPEPMPKGTCSASCPFHWSDDVGCGCGIQRAYLKPRHPERTERWGIKDMFPSAGCPGPGVFELVKQK